MTSPFPGMDPYLEDPAFWPDFHHTFIGCWREAIAEILPEAYEARIDETVQLVHLSEEAIQLIYPDVAVSRVRSRPRKSSRRGRGTAVLQPRIIPHEFIEEMRQGRIEILRRPERSVVAVLELLSPTNKIGEGFAEYCGKRLALLRGKAHLVELDLLVGGRRLPMARPLPAGDYHALVSRADRRPECEVYSWSVRDRLPAVPIPLQAPDVDLLIDLQGVFEQTYTRGRYFRAMHYGRRPLAPMSERDRRWAMAQRPT
jgi:hypothetical protein